MQIKRTLVPKKSGGGSTTIINNSGSGGTIDTSYLTVGTLNADSIITNTLNATAATIPSLTSYAATINDLTSYNANITNLDANYADITGLDADSADITTLVANSAQISALEASNAQITNLTGSYADITQIKTSEISSDYGLTINGAITTNGDITNLSSATGAFDKTVDMEQVNVKLGSHNTFDSLQGNANSELYATNITADYLTVLRSAHFFELVIDKIKASAGTAIFSAADGFEIEKISSTTTYYTLYWRACSEVAVGDVGDKLSETGQTLTEKVSINMWKQYDQAICQTFNLSGGAGTYHDVSNTYWWRMVNSVSDEPEIQEIDGVKYYCHWIKVYRSNTNYVATNSSAPAIGDAVCQLGYRYNLLSNPTADDIARANAIVIAAYRTPDMGVTPPSYAQYQDITDFNLSTHRKSYFDASGAHFVGTLESGTIIDQGVTLPVQIDTWTILADTTVITKDQNNNISPSTIHLKLLHNTGSSSTVLTTLPSDKRIYVNGSDNNNGLDIVVPSFTDLTIELTNAAYSSVFDAITVNTFEVNAADGKNGQYQQFAYRNYATQPSTPSSTSTYPPGGWTALPTTPSATEYVWQIQRTVTFNANNVASYGSWSTPICITAHDGSAGQNGSYYQNIYKNSETYPDTPTSTDYPPSGWTIVPTNPLADEYTWMSQRTISFAADNTIVTGSWSTPIRLTGGDGIPGNDGDGVEYIYNVTTDDEPPTLFKSYLDFPDASLVDDYVEFTIRPGDPGYNTDTNYIRAWTDMYGVRHYVVDSDYLPPSSQSGTNLTTSWTDEPRGTNSALKYEWTAVRTYDGEEKKWSQFSNPVVWSHYGEDGQDGINGTNGINGTDGEDGEYWCLIPIKDDFSVRINDTNNQYIGITGRLNVDLAFGIMHIEGDAANWITTAEMASYSMNLVTDNSTSGGQRNVQSGIQYNNQTVTINGTTIPVLTYTKSNYLEYTANAVSGNYIDYYYLHEHNLTSRMPTKMTVELVKSGSGKVNAYTVNLIFSPDHIFKVADDALNSVYQGLSGDSSGSFTTGFSTIKQQWDSINLSVNNIQKFNGGGFPDNTEYEQYAYYKRTHNVVPTAPTGDVTQHSNVTGEWTTYNVEPSSSQQYVFYTKRTKPTDSLTHNTDQWSAWSTPVLFQVYGSNRGLVNGASLKITADSINSTVQAQGGQINTLQQTATELTNTVSNQGGQISTLTNSVNGLTSRVTNAEGNISTLENTANGLNYVITNIQNTNGLSFPTDNEYEQYVYFKRGTSALPGRPQGDITEDRNIDHAWTKYHLAADATYKYVFISKRTKPTGSSTHSTDTWSEWSYPSLWQINGYNRGVSVTAGLQIQTDSIKTTVSNQGTSISTLQQTADNISLQVDNLEDGLDATGIDITNGKITLNAQNTIIDGDLNLTGEFESYNETTQNRTVIKTSQYGTSGLIMSGPDRVDPITGEPDPSTQEVDLIKMEFTTTAGARAGSIKIQSANSNNVYNNLWQESIGLSNDDNYISVRPEAITYGLRRNTYDYSKNINNQSMSMSWPAILSGSMTNVKSITSGSSYYATLQEGIIIIKTGINSGFKLYLPVPDSENAGKFYFIKNKSNMTGGDCKITVVGASSSYKPLLDNNGDYDYDRNLDHDSLIVCSDGECWILFGNHFD